MSSTFEVPVIKVQLDPHDNADALSIVRYMGYQVIVRTSEWADGDLAAYVRPDSVVPDTPEWAFLEGKRRIRTRRFRGEWSHGLIVHAPEGSVEGDNAADLMGIVNYEPPSSRREGRTGPKVKKSWWTKLKEHIRELGVRPRGKYPHYDIEHLRRYIDLFQDEEEVLVTEKVHGCMPKHAKIKMANDSSKAISEIVSGDYVLGVDTNGNLVPSKVKKLFDNGVNKDGWLNIRFTNKGGNKGNSYRRIFCTHNHGIYRNDLKKYVSAGDLEVGAEVLMHRGDIKLTPLQPILIPQKIIEINYVSSLRLEHKYDIETETGNYISGGILVHNSNACYLWKKSFLGKSKVYMRSRRVWKWRTGTHWWGTAYEATPELEEFLKDHPQYTVYGEVYGNIQDLHYNKSTPHFVAFDIWINESRTWMPQDLSHELLASYGVPCVPILYRGPYKGLEHVTELSEQDSVLTKLNGGGKQISEGCVVSSLSRRVILKVVSDRYMAKVVLE